MFYFPNIIVGTIPYTAFRSFINLEGKYKNMPSTLKPSLITFGKAFLFVIGIKIKIISEVIR